MEDNRIFHRSGIFGKSWTWKEWRENCDEIHRMTKANEDGFLFNVCDVCINPHEALTKTFTKSEYGNLQVKIYTYTWQKRWYFKSIWNRSTGFGTGPSTAPFTVHDRSSFPTEKEAVIKCLEIFIRDATPGALKKEMIQALQEYRADATQLKLF